MRKLHSSTVLAILLASACAPPSLNGGPEDTGAGDAAIQPSPPFNGDPANGATFALDLSVWEGPMAESEMDCFWDSGVRHIIIGTQDEDITREQLAMAVSRGMTVDGYVYLYWNTDTKAQVDLAFQRTAGFPIGRMWLDIEQAPNASTNLPKMMEDALTQCRTHPGVDCGVYTGPGFWKTYVGNGPVLSDAPLWYALYNHKTSLADWSTERFGGWLKPVAKQYAAEAICGVGGADKDVMQVVTQPSVVVDRSLPPDTNQPPPAPTGLYPTDGSVVLLDYAKIMSGTIPRATSYQLAVEHWNGTNFAPYYTWTNPNGFQKFSPQMPNSIYRFRVRAENAQGWGPWSSYASFDYGKYTGPRPGASPPPSPSGTTGSGGNPPPPPPTPATPGAPGSLSPDGGAPQSSQSVTLSCAAVTGASSYDFAIEYESGSTFLPYVTYTTTPSSKTFWPQIHAPYRWRVRATANAEAGPWSAYATFVVP